MIYLGGGGFRPPPPPRDLGRRLRDRDKILRTRRLHNLHDCVVRFFKIMIINYANLFIKLPFSP